MLLLCPAVDQESTPARQAHCGETGFSASQVGQGLACRKYVDTTVLLLVRHAHPSAHGRPVRLPVEVNAARGALQVPVLALAPGCKLTATFQYLRAPPRMPNL